MFRLLLTAAFSDTCKRAHLPTTAVNCARGMAQLESNCALSFNMAKQRRRNAYTPAFYVIVAYLNMYYVNQARYIINVDINRDVFFCAGK